MINSARWRCRHRRRRSWLRWRPPSGHLMCIHHRSSRNSCTRRRSWLRRCPPSGPHNMRIHRSSRNSCRRSHRRQRPCRSCILRSPRNRCIARWCSCRGGGAGLRLGENRRRPPLSLRTKVYARLNLTTGVSGRTKAGVIGRTKATASRTTTNGGVHGRATPLSPSTTITEGKSRAHTPAPTRAP